MKKKQERKKVKKEKKEKKERKNEKKANRKRKRKKNTGTYGAVEISLFYHFTSRFDKVNLYGKPKRHVWALSPASDKLGIYQIVYLEMQLN